MPTRPTSAASMGSQEIPQGAMPAQFWLPTRPDERAGSSHRRRYIPTGGDPGEETPRYRESRVHSTQRSGRQRHQ